MHPSICSMNLNIIKIEDKRSIKKVENLKKYTKVAKYSVFKADYIMLILIEKRQ